MTEAALTCTGPPWPPGLRGWSTAWLFSNGSWCNLGWSDGPRDGKWWQSCGCSSGRVNSIGIGKMEKMSLRISSPLWRMMETLSLDRTKIIFDIRNISDCMWASKMAEPINCHIWHKGFWTKPVVLYWAPLLIMYISPPITQCLPEEVIGFCVGVVSWYIESLRFVSGLQQGIKRVHERSLWLVAKIATWLTSSGGAMLTAVLLQFLITHEKGFLA